MVRGILLDPRSSLNQRQSGTFPAAIPIIIATISIPRLIINNIFFMLMDSGADITSLHLRDAVRVLGLRGFTQLRGETKVGGIGGDAKYYLEPARIFFMHDDGSIEDYNFDLRIAKVPTRIDKLNHALRLPSVLGRDILCHFRVVMDYPRNELYLDHS